MARIDVRDSTRSRRICFETWKRFDVSGRAYMECQCGRQLRPSCGQRIDPVRDKWRADHGVQPWAEGGRDTPANLFPILTACDVEFTAKQDVARIAKNRRVYEKRNGIKKTSRPMPGSRDSPWKKTFSHGWVKR